jgi:PIN domain
MINQPITPSPASKADLTLCDETTPNTILFIDYENITQIRLSRIQRPNLKIFIFVGCAQTKIPFELVREAHQLGATVEWIGVEGLGPNSLDFHIVFYLGQISLQAPATNFVILSRDRGFDPLIQHLGQLGISCKRIENLERLSQSADLSYSPDFLADVALTKLEAIDPKSRPKTKSALYKYLKSLLVKYQPSELDIEELLELLFATGKIIKAQGKVSYDLKI